MLEPDTQTVMCLAHHRRLEHGGVRGTVTVKLDPTDMVDQVRHPPEQHAQAWRVAIATAASVAAVLNHEAIDVRVVLPPELAGADVFGLRDVAEQVRGSLEGVTPIRAYADQFDNMAAILASGVMAQTIQGQAAELACQRLSADDLQRIVGWLDYGEMTGDAAAGELRRRVAACACLIVVEAST